MIRRAISHWLQNTLRPVGFQSVPDAKATIGTDVGVVRRENQDRALIARFNSSDGREDCFTLALLCDGMGGMVAGAQCAEIAASEIIASLALSWDRDASQRLIDGLRHANDAVHAEFGGKGGTTVAVLLIAENLVMGATAGDSRIYHFDGKSFEQASTDDTIAGELARIPGHRIEDWALDSTSRQLAQYVGMGEGFEPRVYHFELTKRHSSYVLTSDGAHAIGERNLLQLFEHSHNGEFVRRALAVSKWLGGYDNATLVQVDVDSTTNKPQFRCDWDSIELWNSDGKLELLVDKTQLLRHSGEATRWVEASRVLAQNALRHPEPSTLPERGERDYPHEKRPRTGYRRDKEKRLRSPEKQSDQQKLEIEVSQPPIDAGDSVQKADTQSEQHAKPENE